MEPRVAFLRRQKNLCILQLSVFLSSFTSRDRGCNKDRTRKRTVSRGFNGPFEDEGSRVVLGLGTGVAFNNTCPTISCYLDQRRALFLNSFSLVTFRQEVSIGYRNRFLNNYRKVTTINTVYSYTQYYCILFLSCPAVLLIFSLPTDK